jgi:hypothetical protein
MAASDIEKLQQVQNAIARLVMRSSRNDDTSALLPLLAALSFLLLRVFFVVE